MQQAETFVMAARHIVNILERANAGLRALAAFQAPTAEEIRAWEERARQAEAEEAAYEAERLRRNPRLRYRSRRPLWWRLKYSTRRRHVRPASLIHEPPDWVDY